MIAKKTPKKLAKKASEIQTLSQLKENIMAKRQTLFEARLSHAAKELTNPHIITITRKEIARLLTAIRLDSTHPKENK
jgi:ribosomal protein L29